MTERMQSLQDVFLNGLRRAKAPVTLFLIKGVKLQGVVTWFDAFSLLLRRDGAAQLVYKHAISTIMPLGPVAPVAPLNAAARKTALQDIFLEAAERAEEPMTVFLVNGVMLQGAVTAHDQFVLLLGRSGQTQLVYKHAISTMQPASPLDLGGDEGADS